MRVRPQARSIRETEPAGGSPPGRLTDAHTPRTDVDRLKLYLPERDRARTGWRNLYVVQSIHDLVLANFLIRATRLIAGAVTDPNEFRRRIPVPLLLIHGTFRRKLFEKPSQCRWVVAERCE